MIATSLLLFFVSYCASAWVDMSRKGDREYNIALSVFGFSLTMGTLLFIVPVFTWFWKNFP
jgi:hypothetical protein